VVMFGIQLVTSTIERSRREKLDSVVTIGD